MNIELDKPTTQENEYNFPYHHLPDYDNGKVQITKFWPWTISYLGRIKLVLDFLDTNKFNNLIDIGCGDGKLINILQKKYKHSSFKGIDCSSRSIQYAKCMNPANETVSFNSFSLTDNDFETVSADLKNSFDIATMIEVLEHIPPDQTDLFLQRSLAFVKPNGHLLLSVPSTNMALSRKHYQHFNTAKLENIFKDHQLYIESVEYIDSDGSFMALLHRLLSNRLFILNNQIIINAIFNYYTKHHLHANVDDGKGIFIVVRKNNQYDLF